MYNIELVVGDWSKDGHNQSDRFFFISTKDRSGVEAAYTQGIEKMQVPEYNNVAEEYEDNILPTEVADKLKAYIDLDSFLDGGDPEEDGGYWLYPETFAKLYVLICQIGDPELLIEEVPSEEIKIGGYGLYN